jgi:hypothetical protein
MYSSTPTHLPFPPRRVRANLRGAIGLWFLRLFILPHTLIGIGLLVNVPWTLLWAVAHSKLPATVIRGEVHTSSKGGTSYKLYYRYRVGEHWLDGSDGVSQAVYQHYQAPGASEQESRPATVRYFELGPFRKVHLVDAGAPAKEVLTFLFIACFWNGILSVFLYLAYWLPWRTRHLCRWGQAAAGTITECYTRSGKSTRYYINYQFPDPVTGQQCSHGMEVSGRALWSKAARGAPVTVLYDPNRPKRSLAYEFAPYRVKSDG